MFGIIILKIYEGDIVIEHIIKTSQERSWIVKIIYSGSSGISERNIKVLEIQDNKIKAYCYLRKQVRYFKKDSILSAAYWEGSYYGKNSCGMHSGNEGKQYEAYTYTL